MPVSPIRLSGRFASVDVAPLGEYMCRRHMRTYRKRVQRARLSPMRLSANTCAESTCAHIERGFSEHS